MSYIQTLIEQIIVMFLFIGLGVFIGKKKLFSETTIKELGDFLFKFIAPINVVNSLMIGYSDERAKQLLISLLVSIVVYVLSIVVSSFVLNYKKYPVEHYSAIISNCGFMCLPIVLYVCGNDAGIYATPFIACNICLQMTYGNFIMSGDKNEIKLKSILTNTSVIGVIVGFIYFFARIPVIGPLKTCCSSLSALVAPFSCILIGINLANTNLIACLKDKMGFVAILLRQIVMPLIAVILMYFIDNDMYVMKLALVIVVAAPVASGTSVFARKYNQDYEMASRLVCVSTLLTIITIPLITTIATLIW